MEPGFFKCSNRLSVHRQCKQLIATSFTLYLATSYNVLVIRTMNWEIGEWAWDGTGKNKFIFICAKFLEN
jgi:hypothetical protein